MKSASWAVKVQCCYSWKSMTFYVVALFDQFIDFNETC